ncbi:secreted protein, partial [Candidatus Magnetomorum sp. HK-1]
MQILTYIILLFLLSPFSAIGEISNVCKIFTQKDPLNRIFLIKEIRNNSFIIGVEYSNGEDYILLMNENTILLKKSLDKYGPNTYIKKVQIHDRPDHGIIISVLYNCGDAGNLQYIHVLFFT